MMPPAKGAAPASLPANAWLAIQLEGNGIELGTVSAGTICRYVDAFRLGLQATIEMIEAVQPVQATGRRKRWIERMADLPLVGIESGCVRILLGAPSQDGLFAEAEQGAFARAVEWLFQSLAAASAEDGTVPEPTRWPLPPWTEQRLLNIVVRLMPPRRGPLHRIAFLRRLSDDEPGLEWITLDRQSRQRIERRIEQWHSDPDGPIQTPTLTRYLPGGFF